LAGDGFGSSEMLRQAGASAVGSEDDVGIEHGNERFEVTLPGRCDERLDNLPLSSQVGIWKRIGSADAAAGSAGELPRRLGTHNSPASAEPVRKDGAKPVLLDLLDAAAVRQAVLEQEPEAIVHEATALANAKFSRNVDKVLAKTSELRTKGTDALLAAVRETGVRRFVAQSFAPFRYAREGGPIKTEDDPLDPIHPLPQSAAAMAYLEQSVTDFGGIALRYGAFYGAANDALIEPVRKRLYPIVGDGGGITPWIHLDDAAAATVLALEHEGPAIYNVVDDDPAPVREWLPVIADALGAKPPRHFPAWLARLFAGDVAVMMGTETRGASNTKAKRELAWRPAHPSWRQGFAAA
jgi:2-alkyl-3-oxoalkanoate reductase